jgi:hypothetical protein
MQIRVYTWPKLLELKFGHITFYEIRQFRNYKMQHRAMNSFNVLREDNA